jgi:hypothetical protein
MPLYDLDMFYWLCYAQFVLGWFILILWGQRLIFHHECLAHLLYLVEGHKFLFVSKIFHVPIWIRKWNVNCLENVLPFHMCLIYLLLGAKPLHDAYQWEVSYIEVGTWLGGFDMKWGAWGCPSMKFVWLCHFDMFCSCLGLCSWEGDFLQNFSILS